MQVDPIQPTLKAPGTKRLKLDCDEPLSNCAFKLNLRRYKQVPVYCQCEMPYNPDLFMVMCEGCEEWYHPQCLKLSMKEAGPDTPPLFCSTSAVSDKLNHPKHPLILLNTP